MRALCDNIFKNILQKNILQNGGWTTSSSDDFFPIENIFDYHTLNIGRFDNKTFGELTANGKGIINCFAVFNTNARLIKIEINNDEETIEYEINIENSQAICNIPPVEFLECKITFYGEETNENNLECGYLIIGEAVDFPPHDKAKTHTVNYTHSQYFSVSNHYFRRTLPVRKYDTWKVSFSYLTNDDKEKIEKFFDDSDFYPFVLQVWKEADISQSKTNSLSDKINDEIKEKINDSFNKRAGVKYYMKSGLYVCSNDKIDFKKGKNDLYQYSCELTFREVN